MLVVRTSEGRADPICQLVGAQQTVGFDHPTLAVYPLGLYGVEPWALFGQQAADDPHPGFATALFDLPVMSGHPLSNLFGDVPGGVVPDQHPNLLARRLKLLAAPRKEAGGYGAHGDGSSTRISSERSGSSCNGSNIMVDNRMGNVCS